MMTISEAQRAIVDDFLAFDDWSDRYTYLIACSALLPPMPAEYRTSDYLFKGCASAVWLSLSIEGGRLSVLTDSDSLIVRGILSLMSKLFSGRFPAEIAAAEFTLLDQTGISANMPSDRAGGMRRIAEEIRIFAARHANADPYR